MSEPINRETHDLLRQQAILAIKEAAKKDNISIHADELALVSQPRLMCVNAPMAGIEKLDFKALLDGKPILDDVPIMYWHLSGDGLGSAKGSIPEGFYTVVAHQKRGVVSLRDAKGKTVAGGDLTVVIENPPTVLEKVKVSGGIDSVDVGWTHIKICGHVTVSDGKKSVTVSGCVSAGL